MKTVLKTPELVAEARGEKNGWNWAVELLPFVEDPLCWRRMRRIRKRWQQAM